MRARAAPQTDRSFAAVLALAAILAVYAIVVLRTAWLCDDSYITFRTVDNFVGGYGLRWNTAERVQSFTHPLWLLLLTGLYASTREIYLTALISSVVLSLAVVTLVGWQARRWRIDPLVLAAGLGILVVSRAFVDYSTSGLENPLTHLLLAAFVVVFLDESETSVRKLFVLGLLAGLGTLNRMDCALLFLPPLAWALGRTRRWKGVAAILLGLTPFFLWEVFAVIYYGFPFPNTAYAKLGTGIDRLDYWDHGLAYFRNSLARDPVTLLATAGGVAAGLAWRSWKRLALVASVLLYLLYVLDVGGDFMSGRAFTAPLLVSVILLFEAGSHLQAIWLRRLLPVVVLLAGFVGATPTLLSGKDYGEERNILFDDSGVSDERALYYPATGLLSDTPLAARPSFKTGEQGRKARRMGDPLIVGGAAGFAGFFAGPDTYVVDYYALVDPLLARLPMVKSDPFFGDFCAKFSGQPCRGSWRTGHCRRNVPAGYLDSILAGENRLVDDDLRQYYERIRVITRGPIWSAERWREILAMNLGLDDHLRGPMQLVDYRPTRFAEAYERYPDVRSVSLLSGAGRDYVERGTPEKAIACYQKVIAIDPTSHDAWNNLGQVLLWHGDNAAGEAALLESIKLRPGRPEPYVALADHMTRTGRRSEVLSLFQSLAAAGDKTAEDYLRRAQPQS